MLTGIALTATPSLTADIDWGALGWVTLTTLIAVVVIVTFYSLGLRLLAVGTGVGGDSSTDAGSAQSVAFHRAPLATVAAVICIAIGVAAVIYGIYLVIPIFHS